MTSKSHTLLAKNYVSLIDPNQFRYFLFFKTQITGSFLVDSRTKMITDYEETPENHLC
jgi:hypothetical protein